MTETFELPLFPLNTVLFPGMVLPLHIFEGRYKQMLKRCINESKPFGVVLLRTGEAEGDSNQEIHDVGTVAQITQVNRLPNDRFQILTLGVQRFRIQETHRREAYLTGIVEDFPLDESNVTAESRQTRLIAKRLVKYLDVIKNTGDIELDLDEFPSDPVTLAFLAAIIMPISNEEKQELLSAAELLAILENENGLLRREILFLDVLTQPPPSWAEHGPTFSPN